ncbi:hypothetical protein [Methylobacterium sp. 77]|uniref:hypothetical protein n=1 Tax=Methylobacterium sp. 77 TaxID=1101192 RepID=UPI000371D011|nr:hypothetical protein [Methylobacterium sp. 77]
MRSSDHPAETNEALAEQIPAVERSAVGSGGALICDEAMLAEIEDLLGRDHLMQLLSLLKSEIGGRFRSGNDDRIALGHDAHALLASSGSLGFLDLSQRCSMIERACMDGADITIPMHDARVAAERALVAIAALEARG